MVELRNITESIVIDYVENLKEVKEHEINNKQKVELIAYCLNRVKPLYMTSTRGFIHLLIKYENDPQFFADIMMGIAEGLKVVKNKIYEDTGIRNFILLRNITEYLVVEAVYDLPEVKNGILSENQKIELFAYILNRVKAHYTTDEEEFTEEINKYKRNKKYLAEIKTYCDEGLKIIMKTVSPKPLDISQYSDKICFVFPRIFGKIISLKSFNYIDYCKVYLYLSGELSKPFLPGWENPMELKPSDNGVYSFAPAPIETDKANRSKEFEFKLLITNDFGNSYEKTVKFEAISIKIDDIRENIHENVLQFEDIYVPF